MFGLQSPEQGSYMIAAIYSFLFLAGVLFFTLISTVISGAVAKNKTVFEFSLPLLLSSILCLIFYYSLTILLAKPLIGFVSENLVKKQLIPSAVFFSLLIITLLIWLSGGLFIWFILKIANLLFAKLNVR
jgi:hypothetical protein